MTRFQKRLVITVAVLGYFTTAAVLYFVPSSNGETASLGFSFLAATVLAAVGGAFYGVGYGIYRFATSPRTEGAARVIFWVVKAAAFVGLVALVVANGSSWVEALGSAIVAFVAIFYSDFFFKSVLFLFGRGRPQ